MPILYVSDNGEEFVGFYNDVSEDSRSIIDNNSSMSIMESEYEEFIVDELPPVNHFELPDFVDDVFKHLSNGELLKIRGTCRLFDLVAYPRIKMIKDEFQKERLQCQAEYLAMCGLLDCPRTLSTVNKNTLMTFLISDLIEACVNGICACIKDMANCCPLPQSMLNLLMDIYKSYISMQNFDFSQNIDMGDGIFLSVLLEQAVPIYPHQVIGDIWSVVTMYVDDSMVVDTRVQFKINIVPTKNSKFIKNVKYEFQHEMI